MMRSARLGRRRARRSEAGQASLELIGFLPYLLLAAIFVWQLLLVGYTAMSATNAARSGARVGSLSQGGDGGPAAIGALPEGLRGNATIGTCLNGTCVISVDVPIVWLSLGSPFTVTRKSYFAPSTPGMR